jgi:hypothetical protein
VGAALGAGSNSLPKICSLFEESAEFFFYFRYLKRGEAIAENGKGKEALR